MSKPQLKTAVDPTPETLYGKLFRRGLQSSESMLIV